MKRKRKQADKKKELQLNRRVIRRLVDLRGDELNGVNGGMAKETNNLCVSDA